MELLELARVAPPVDRLGRPLHDLRISVTDRCNFRCTYCMPREVFGADFQFLPRAELLTFEEITRLARLFIDAGVEKIRLTGGGEKDPPPGGRATRSPRPRAAGGPARAAAGSSRPDADDQRLTVGAK